MKTTIVLEYDFTEFNVRSVKDLLKYAIDLDDREIAKVIITHTKNDIVYQSGDKVLRVGDTVKHSNQFFKDTGIILPTPEDYFDGFVCVRWSGQMTLHCPSGEPGSDLIKVVEE